MASVKDLRDKPLSDMSYQELTDFIKRAEKAGYSISKSKELGKAENLRKLLRPDKYGKKTVEDAKKSLKVSTTTETQAKLGIGGSSSSSGLSGMGFSGGGTPTLDLNKLYDDLMNSPELKALNDELVAKKKAKDEASANINDNPFYAEATRVGKQAKLDEKANDEINTLQYQIDQKKADAQVRINIATQQYNIESQEYQQNLQKLNMLITSGALMNASGSDISQIAVATGMSTEMVKGIIDKMKSDQIKPQVITSTNDSGVVTVSVVDSMTGKVINQSSLGAVGNKQNTPGGSLKDSDIQQVIISKLASQTGKATGVNNDDYVSGNTYSAIRNQMVSLGYMTSAQFDDLYALSFVNPNYWNTDTYNIVSPKVKETFESM